MKQDAIQPSSKALPHPCLKGKKTGLTQDRASQLQFGLTQDQAATHPGPFAMVYGYIHCPIKVQFIHVEMKFSDYIHDDGIILDESNSGQLIFIKYSALLEHS